MNKKPSFFIVACLMICTLAFSGCADSDSDKDADDDADKDVSRVAEYQKISQKEAKEIMDGGEPYILVDVRTKDEYDEMHIRGAILIPIDELLERAEMELPDKAAVILVYCRTGVRSKTASETLANLEYTGVKDIGGISTWPYDNVE